MTEHYVTLFDSVFLPQGLALHHSLLEHGGDCLLWVLCLDEDCLNTLGRLDLPQTKMLDLAKLETPELLHVKPCRSRAEYCWTLTPWSIQWVLEAEPSARRVTYVDADVYFLKSPAPVFREFEDSGCAVLITEHGYAPEYDYTPAYGRYCVQFLPVLRGEGEKILHWWRDRCIEWCFARPENGLFGDQKYIEQFEAIFPDQTFALKADRRFQAPWNSVIFPFSDAILFHFHGLRFLSKRFVRLSGEGYTLPSPVLQYVYAPYCRLIRSLTSTGGVCIVPQATKPPRLVLMWLRVAKWFTRKYERAIQASFWHEPRSGSTDGFIW